MKRITLYSMITIMTFICIPLVAAQNSNCNADISYDDYLEQAHNTSNYDRATAIYNCIIGRFPDQAEVHFELGMLHYEEGIYFSAMNSLETAFVLDPDNMDAYYYHGRSIIHLESISSTIEIPMVRIENAIRSLSTVIENEPNNVNAYFYRGTAYYLSDSSLDSAIDDFRVVLEHEPNNINAYFNRALVYLEIGDLDSARSDFERILELDPDDSESAQFIENIENGVYTQSPQVSDTTSIQTSSPSEINWLRVLRPFIIGGVLALLSAAGLRKKR